MYRYEQLEYRAGATLEVVKHIPVSYRKKEIREPSEKKSKEEIQKANMIQAARKLARKINANFRPGDFHITLTYRKENRPDPEEAKVVIRRFLDKMRNRYKKAGYMFKYILVTEYKSKSLHHHLICNNINDGTYTTVDYTREYWRGNGNPKFVNLYDNADYTELATYLIKETERTFRESPEKQRYTCSRNLIDPKPKKIQKTVKERWEMDPGTRKGYYMAPDSLHNGFDRWGYPYQRYVMIKLNPSKDDWPSDRCSPKEEEKHE